MSFEFRVQCFEFRILAGMLTQANRSSTQTYKTRNLKLET